MAFVEFCAALFGVTVAGVAELVALEFLGFLAGKLVPLTVDGKRLIPPWRPGTA